jgi:outer membrane receptor protein involved in Fe transport
MNYRNLFTLFGVIFISTSLLADNPGEDEMVVAEPEVVEAEADTVEQVEAEEVVPADEATETEDGAVVLEKVVVTGSKIKKTQIEGPLPLLVITKEDIDNSGFRNLTEVLQTIPSANQSTDNESIQGSFTPNANELDLRNLGPGRILYLINGRRTADYPVPFGNAGNISNVGVIPVGLIDRVEVLAQGSSAIYGSDAVTGVVNVITVKGKDFSQLDVDYSQTQYEQKDIYSLAYTTGGFFGNSSWTVGVELSHVDPMTYADRPGHDSFVYDPDYGTSYVRPRYGLNWYTGVFGGKVADYGSGEFPSTPSCSEVSGGEFFNFDKQDPEWNYAGSYPGAFCGWDYGSERFGGSSQTIVNERDDVSIVGSFVHNFDNGIELNARVFAYHDEAYVRSLPRYYQQAGYTLDPLRIMNLASTSTNPANRLGPNEVILGTTGVTRDFTPAMGFNAEARQDITEDVEDIFIGLNGFFENGFEWEFGMNHTTYEYLSEKQTFTTELTDYMNGVGAKDANGNLLTGTYRNYQYGGDGRLAFLNSIGYFDDLGRVATVNDALAVYGLPTDPVCGEDQYFGVYNSCFLPDRIMGVYSNELIGEWLEQDNLPAESSQTSIDLLVTGEFELLGKFVGFAATLEHQTQDYNIGPTRTDPSIEFIQGVGYEGGGDRDRNSVGVELLFPVTDKLEMTIASRYDSYDDKSSNVGSRVSNMVNFAYRPHEKVLIRGSASETFRAPDMNYLFAGTSSGFYNGILDWVGCYVDSLEEGWTDITECERAGDNVRAEWAGNPTLEEEEGENYQLGVVWDINSNWDLTVDLYQVILENIIGRDSYRTINIAEGYCLYGEAFGEFIRTENNDQRDCATIAQLTGRADPVANPVTGIAPPIGRWNFIVPGFINKSYREYQGADWTLNYRLETENMGDFSVGILSSHIISYYSRSDANSPEVEWLSTYTYEPRSQQNMSINWRYQDFSTTLFFDRTGHMEWGSRGKSEPHIIANISTRYDYSPDVDLYFSIRNLDDTMPQQDSGYGYPYYNQRYFSAFGRYYSAGFNYRF